MASKPSSQEIQNDLALFGKKLLKEAAINFFGTLGYASGKTLALDSADTKDFLAIIDPQKKIDPAKASIEDWKKVHFLFQLTNDEIPTLAAGQKDLLAGSRDWQQGMIESFVFLAIELSGADWSRTRLANITREVNRRFPMPVIILFKHERKLSLVVIDRRPNKKDASRDVIDGRISIIRDIDPESPHRAHIDILQDMALSNLGGRYSPTNFRALYDAWLQVLSAQELNKRFYEELANWYFWALRITNFPEGQPLDSDDRPSVAVIRLLTRLIFVWFVKEKGLVPEELFLREKIKFLLASDPANKPDDSTYYKAILQNLFFATLNTEQSVRGWKQKENGKASTDKYLIHTVYRYRDYFKNPDEALELFSHIPFLNGGLFECLDRRLSEQDVARNPGLEDMAVKEGNGLVLRVDGFSERKENPLCVPNRLFFASEETVDLNTDYGTKGKTYKASGLIEIFSRYKFTVEENTPVEEEVALDPELLGKVFENLLASYNEDTKTTARKLSGSFYTPREVVDYMVDEALIAHFEKFLQPLSDADTLDTRLRSLLSYTKPDHDFSDTEIEAIIESIEGLRALDPACGSGAFPMGLLQKLVHVLKKLDPDNARWKARNRAPLEAQRAEAKKIPDSQLKEEKTDEAEKALDKLDEDFSDTHYADYSRKLYLIEKCLYGVDIQPIAVQIAKLRFFIALVVSQRFKPKAKNGNITALPNLETKLVAADSLMPIDRPAQGGLRDPRIGEKELELREAGGRYFAARTGKTKRKWKNAIYTLRDELADLLEKDLFLESASAQQLAHWDPFDQNAAAGFFDSEWMFQLTDGFDIVIGNPPYVRQEEIKHLKDNLKKHYECYSGTADLYVYFYEQSIKFLKPGGAFAFITSNKWYRAKYGEKLRAWMNSHTQIRRLIDFGDANVFTAIAYPTIVIATRRRKHIIRPLKSDQIMALNWTSDRPVETFASVFEKESFTVSQEELDVSGWQIETPLKKNLLDRIRSLGKPLGKYCNQQVFYGIKTGFNKAFEIDTTIKDRLIAEDKKSQLIIKPFLRGRDIKRWHVESQEKWLIFTRRGINIDEYPAVLSYLEGFKKELTPKPADWEEKKKGKWPGRKSGSYKWYEIQDNIAYWQGFEKPKIFVPAIQNGVHYAPDLEGYYGNDKTNIIVSDDWKYLSAVLNSSISWWVSQQTFSSKQGGFYEFKPMYISDLPIPAAKAEHKEIIETIVHALLEPRSEVYKFEQLSNAFVYELFFPEELHAKKLRFFDAAEKAGILKLSGLKGDALRKEAKILADKIFSTSHPLYAMLFDLQALDIVRIIEGKE
ncbi:MAG: Eco57I restriction-modification methylase domain-containing protein [Micavibrio sp.]